MSKGMKRALLFAIICLSVGLALAKGALIMWDGEPWELTLNQQSLELQQTSYTAPEAVHSVNINAYDCDIMVAEAADGVVRISYYAPANGNDSPLKHEIYVEDGTLFFDRQLKLRWWEDVRLFGPQKMSVTLYLPAGEYRALQLESVAGDLYLPAGYCFETAALNTVSGDAELLAETRDTLQLQSVSGNLTLQGAAQGDITAETVSGDVRLSSLTAGDLHLTSTSGDVLAAGVRANSLHTETVSGDIELSDVVTAQTTSLVVTSGDIELTACDAAEYRFDSLSGDIRASLLSPKLYQAATTSGKLLLPEADRSGGWCYIDTMSGNAQITILQ